MSLCWHVYAGPLQLVILMIRGKALMYILIVQAKSGPYRAGTALILPIFDFLLCLILKVEHGPMYAS